MWIDEVAVLVSGADAVRIAVGAKAGVAMVLDRRFAERANMRLDRLGVDLREKWVDVAANLHVIDADAGEDVGDESAAGAVHGINGEFHA